MSIHAYRQSQFPEQPAMEETLGAADTQGRKTNGEVALASKEALA
jgi:hypothetical protein